MKITNYKGTIDPGEHQTVLVFENYDELNSFLKLLATVPVSTSGIRVLALPLNRELNQMDKIAQNLISYLDGVTTDNIDEKIDYTSSILKNL